MLVGVRHHLAHQILAGDAEMHRALRELAGDLRRRKVGDFNAVETGNGAAIVACAARLDEFKARAGKKRLGVLLQPALRRDGEEERRAS